MTTILYDKTDGSAITNVEVRESDTNPYPAVSFTKDAERDTVYVVSGDGDYQIALEVSSEAFWSAILLLSGEATDEEVEDMTSGDYDQ